MYKAISTIRVLTFLVIFAFWIPGETSKSGVVITSSRLTDNSTRLMQDPNKTTNNSTEYSKQGKTGTKIINTNISKIQLNQEDSLTEQVNHNSN